MTHHSVTAGYVTARDLLRVLGHEKVDLASPVWIGTSIPGEHEARRAYVMWSDGTVHLSDEEGETCGETPS